MTKRVLVTGGAGFIGSHVADAYLAQSREVIVLNKVSHGRRENVPEGADFVELDIRDSADAQTFGWIEANTRRQAGIS